jgi:hypothetical protein
MYYTPICKRLPFICYTGPLLSYIIILVLCVENTCLVSNGDRVEYLNTRTFSHEGFFKGTLMATFGPYMVLTACQFRIFTCTLFAVLCLLDKCYILALIVCSLINVSREGGLRKAGHLLHGTWLCSLYNAAVQRAHMVLVVFSGPVQHPLSIFPSFVICDFYEDNRQWTSWLVNLLRVCRIGFVCIGQYALFDVSVKI